MNYNKPTNGLRGAIYRAERKPNKSPGTLAQLTQLGSNLRSIGRGALLGTLEKTANVARFLAPLAFGLFILWGIVTALGSALDLTEVHKSWTTRECVHVVLSDGSAGSCDDLPNKYRVVWVR